MARRPRSAVVTWREGVHITDTPVWCDARRRRDVCFVSAADRVGRVGHGQLIATPLTLALLGPRRATAIASEGHLGVPLRQRFALGALRLELISSGRGPGAAGLYLDIEGRRVLYMGAIRSDGGVPGVEPAELRACDAVVLDAPFGASELRFPPLAEVVAATVQWISEQLAAARTPVLLVDSVLDGLEISHAVRHHGIATVASRAIRDAEQRALRAGFGSHLSLDRSARGAIVWPAGDRASLARTLGERSHAIARVSGQLGDHSDHLHFAWPSAADRSQLLDYAAATKAREVYVTGRCAESIVRALGDRGRLLAPPRQMALALGATP